MPFFLHPNKFFIADFFFPQKLQIYCFCFKEMCKTIIGEGITAFSLQCY